MQLEKVTDVLDQLQMYPSNSVTFPDQFNFLFSTMTISNYFHSILKPLIPSFSVYHTIFYLTDKIDPLDGNLLVPNINAIEINLCPFLLYRPHPIQGQSCPSLCISSPSISSDIGHINYPFSLLESLLWKHLDSFNQS